jgi:tetratricopeptide (TPR) repeat protein
MLKQHFSKGGTMLKYLKLGLLPVMVTVIAGCTQSFSLDAAQRLEGSGDFQGALPQYDDYIKAKPKDILGYRGKAHCQIKLGDAKGAEQTLRDGTKADIHDVDAKVELATLFLDRKDYMEANEVLNEGYTFNQKNLALVSAMARLQDDQGNYEAAVEKYKEALALDPNNIDLHTKLAHVYGLLNKFDDAKKELGEVDRIKLQPKKPQ